MKLRLSILLLAAALAAAPAAGQAIKSLGYNTTNGQVVYSGTNALTFTNSLQFATNARAATRTNLGGTTVGNSVFTATNAAAAATAVGLGVTNNVRFNSVELLQSGEITNSITYWIDGLSFVTDGVEYFATDGGNGGSVRFEKPITMFNSTNAATTRDNLGLGTTNAVTFGNITATGTLGVSNAATFSTNVTIDGNATLNGVGNIAPHQTASSADSVMTRDLVGRELANPRNKIQTTYWFGMEGLGLWQLVNSGASVAANRGPKIGPSLAFYTGTRSSANAAGLGLRLGATAISGGSMWRPLDGGAFTAKTHVVNYFSASSAGNRAFGFSFAAGANTNFWGNPDSFGLFWVQQPTNTWAASTPFTANDRIAVSNVVWTVATAGTTDTNEPVWTDLINSTVTNGTAAFRNLGPHTSNNWVLAIGHTNASQVVMTNTGKSNWLRTGGNSGHEVLLTLRYGTNTTAPYTVYGSVADGTGQGAEVTLNLPTNNVSVSPQYWLRYDSTNSSGANDVAGIRYFSIDAELPPLD